MYYMYIINVENRYIVLLQRISQSVILKLYKVVSILRLLMVQEKTIHESFENILNKQKHFYKTVTLYQPDRDITIMLNFVVLCDFTMDMYEIYNIFL